MGVLSGKRFKDALFINMDGIRIGGPASGQKHRLMEQNDPDKLTPYKSYYSSWFNEIKRGIDYKAQSVCFKEIYFQPAPGVNWLWDRWNEVKPCVSKQYADPDNGLMRTIPSPLYQSFNYRKLILLYCSQDISRHRGA